MAATIAISDETADFNREYVGLQLEERLIALWERVQANGGQRLRETSCVFDAARGPQYLLEFLGYCYENPEELPDRVMESDAAFERDPPDVLLEFDDGIFRRPPRPDRSSRGEAISPETVYEAPPEVGSNDAEGPEACGDSSDGERGEHESSASQ